MTGADLVAALTPVADALEALGVPYFITGSLASSMHGVARASLDVDVVAGLRPEHADRFAAALGSAFYVDRDRIRFAIRLKQSFNLIHLATMFKVDVFVTKGRPFDQAAMTRVRAEALDESSTARVFPVASAEDVILSKLEWFRAGGQTSERQWSDVIGVLKAEGPRLQLDYLRASAESLGVAHLLERAIGETGLTSGT
jgi:hypothetical protein